MVRVRVWLRCKAEGRGGADGNREGKESQPRPISQTVNDRHYGLGVLGLEGSGTSRGPCPAAVDPGWGAICYLILFYSRFHVPSAVGCGREATNCIPTSVISLLVRWKGAHIRMNSDRSCPPKTEKQFPVKRNAASDEPCQPPDSTRFFSFGQPVRTDKVRHIKPHKQPQAVSHDEKPE